MVEIEGASKMELNHTECIVKVDSLINKLGGTSSSSEGQGLLITTVLGYQARVFD